jgi:hypothetical protein
MCFSAAASFSSAALLVPLGIAAVQRSWQDHRPELLPLALMPVGFGLQQGLEGVVWLGLNHGPAAPLLKGGALAYLFFALALWPIWIPYVVLSLWPQQRHWPGRPLLWTLQGAGLVLGIGLWLPLLLQPTRIEPVVLKGSIDYGLTLLMSGGLAESIRYLYAAVIGLPLLLLPYAWLRSFGVALLASGLVAEWAYRQAFLSVWCYLSALLSVLIVWIIYTKRLPTKGQAKAAS